MFIRHDIQQWRMLDEYAVLASRTGNKAEALNANRTLVNSPLFTKVVPDNEKRKNYWKPNSAREVIKFAY